MSGDKDAMRSNGLRLMTEVMDSRVAENGLSIVTPNVGWGTQLWSSCYGADYTRDFPNQQWSAALHA